MIHNIAAIHSDHKHRVKDAEKAHIMSLIATGTAVTRKRLVDSMNIRPTTISNVVQELIEQRLVTEGSEINPGSQGRPERRLNPQFERLVAVAIRTVSRTLIAELVDFGDHVLFKAETELCEDAGNTQTIEAIADLVAIVRREVPLGAEEIGVGIAVPGIVSPAKGLWLKSSRWPNLQKIDMKQVESRVGLPVRLSGIREAELRYLMEVDPRLADGGTVLCHWGYGVGAAYAYGGTVLTSRIGSFADIGHTTVRPDSETRCTCGDIGCLETESGLWALIPDIQDRFPHASDQEHEFAEFIRTVDIEQLPRIESAIDAMAIALSNLYRTLHPDRIMIFGPFTQQHTITERLRGRFLQRVPRYATGSVAFEIVTEHIHAGQAFGATDSLFRDRLRQLLVVG